MRRAECDLCGSDKAVEAPFLRLWNGHEIDLCMVCAQGSDAAKALNALFDMKNRRLQGRPAND